MTFLLLPHCHHFYESLVKKIVRIIAEIQRFLVNDDLDLHFQGRMIRQVFVSGLDASFCEFVTVTMVFIYITPEMLPVSQRVEYKVCRFVFKCIYQRCASQSGSWQSSSSPICRGDLVVPRAKGKIYDPNSFAIAALWRGTINTEHTLRWHFLLFIFQRLNCSWEPTTLEHLIAFMQ